MLKKLFWAAVIAAALYLAIVVIPEKIKEGKVSEEQKAAELQRSADQQANKMLQNRGGGVVTPVFNKARNNQQRAYDRSGDEYQKATGGEDN
jgi:hypothetical protein